jgi:hypothetical protein
MTTTTLTRRTLLNTAALATTTLALPIVHGAHAAGKLSCGFWDHWVPGAMSRSPSYAASGLTAKRLT